VWLGHSATRANFVGEHSHAKPPPQFVGPGRVPAERCCARPLSGPPKRRRTAGSLQPERYAKLFLHLYPLDKPEQSEITQERTANLWNAPPSMAAQNKKGI
jgi:hypothetical protein